MTEIETHDPAERPLLARTFETGAEIAADGRNVELLCAPFDIPATVTDPPFYTPYEEEFARGAFSGATKAPNRVLLEFEHFHPGLSGVIGHGAELEERSDALYGRFRVTDHPDGDKALALIRDDVLKAASVFFQPIKSERREGGLMRRLKVRLDRVAIARVGTWPQAQILSVRTGPHVDDDEEPEIVSIAPALPGMDPELVARLAEHGFAIPERLGSVAS